MKEILFNLYKWRSSLFVKSLYILGIFLLVTSCNNEEIAPPEERLPELSASATTIVLNQEDATESAVKFSWTAGSNYGSNAGIEYTLQFDVKGNEFNNPLNVELGRTAYSKTYRVSDFNKLLVDDLGVAPEDTEEIEVRVISKVVLDAFDPDYSNTVALTVTTFVPLAEPDYNELWIVGSATPVGWDIDNADEFSQDEDNPFVFTYTAYFTAGEFKIATAKSWEVPFYRPALGESGDAQNAPISHETVQLSSGDPDHKWEVDAEGYYKIVLDIDEMTISVEPVLLYIIGDAGPNGWDIGGPDPMERSGKEFTYSGPLTAGEFKISTFKGDWCDGDWINSATENQDITNESFIITHGCEGPDNKWKVTESAAGNYTITINLDEETMSIVAN